jgi:hypothetical protein
VRNKYSIINSQNADFGFDDAESLDGQNNSSMMPRTMTEETL